jgi:hypothetical protein
MAMRQKAMAAQESAKGNGEPIKLLVPLPVEGGVAQAELETDAYEVGRAYTQPIVNLHQALMRAGYPAHIVDERVLPARLGHYKVVFVNGQTFELPANVRQALASFVQGGGTVLAGRSTTVDLPGAIVHDVDMSSDTVRARELLWQRDADAAATKCEASAFRTSHCFSAPVREAAHELKEVLRGTGARPVLESNDVDLLAERHVCADGALYMVLNVHEQYPQVADDEEYPRYNFAPATATYTLPGIKPGSAVYLIEGLAWNSVRRIENPHLAQAESFDAGEMKLYLVCPRAPTGIALQAADEGGAIDVTARLQGAHTPWPVALAVLAPDGSKLHRVHRALDRQGTYAERFPIGGNATSGSYEVLVSSPVGDLSARAPVEVVGRPVSAQVVRDAVRVFDEAQIRRFLKDKPDLVVAIGKETQRLLADRLAAGLRARGLRATARPEAEVLRKVAYPRVWSPYATVYAPGTPEVEPPGDVTAELHAGMVDGETVVVDGGGRRLLDEAWRQPGALVTVTGDGLVDWLGRDLEQCYEPGVKLYVDDQRKVTALNAIATRKPTTAAFRARWARPWTRLYSYVGSFQLPPQLPEAYTTDAHLVMLGDSRSGFGVAALQASELLLQTVDDAYPGPGKALIAFVWSPFAVERNVVFVGASDDGGLRRGARRLLELAR